MDYSKEKNLEKYQDAIWLIKEPVDLPLPHSVTLMRSVEEFNLKGRDTFASIRALMEKSALSSKE